MTDFFRDNSGHGLPAVVSGTSGDFLDGRSLPSPVEERLVAFVAGPPGVGKSTVARSLAGPDASELCAEAVLNHLHSSIPWPQAITVAGDLVLELPSKNDHHDLDTDRIKELIRLRVGSGLPTRVVASAVGTTLPELMFAVDPAHRVTIALRFPVGEERRRYAEQICSELGISVQHAEPSTVEEPWSYEKVRTHLEACVGQTKAQ